MSIESIFKHDFYLTHNGNYYSRRNGITIYKKAHRGVWAYCLTRDQDPVYGRLEFNTPLECYQWMVQRRLM
jgi:hypothetical protein